MGGITSAIPHDIAWRVIGALLGFGVSYFTAHARTWTGLLSRFVVSMVAGVVFADPIAEAMNWSLLSPNKMIAASCIGGFSGWWAAHAFRRMIVAKGGD